MNTLRKFVRIILLFLLFSSCNNGTLPIYFENKITDKVNIDILVPPATGLKYDVSSLGLLQVNYVPTNQKIIEKYEDKETNITAENIYDAIQSNYDGFFSEADEKTEIQIQELPESIVPNETFDWEKLAIIADSLKFDALFFINNVKITFDIKTEIPMDGSSNGYNESYLNCNSVFFYTILYPDKRRFETIVSSFSDSFEGDSYYFGSKPAYLHSSQKIKKVLPYLCFETGKRAVYEFFPVWIPVSRKYYGRASKELRQAKKLINNGMWEEAIKIWKDNKNNKNRVIAKQCQYNLILAEELTGSLEKAIRLAENHYLNYKEDIALEYIKVLEKRFYQQEKLKNL